MPRQNILAFSDPVLGHVLPVRDAHTLDGLRVASSSAFGSSIDRAAFFAVSSSMARRSFLLAGPVGRHAGLPELKDADYIREVLARPDGVTEADLEQDLVSRAAALGIEWARSGGPNTQEQGTPAVEIIDGLDSQQARGISTGSDEIADPGEPSPTSDHAAATTPLTPTNGSMRRRSRSLSFSQYELYISQVDPALDQPKFVGPAQGKSDGTTGNGAKPGAKWGVKDFTRSIAARLKRRKPSPNLPMPCICCREEFTAENHVLHTLPCGHSYCSHCLAIMVEQSMSDESKMPPRCCTQPIPSAIIKLVLPREKQTLFLKAVVQYSTPWEARIFCPNPACGEFIPPSTTAALDPKHPFVALCKACRTRVCVMCKRTAHQLGQDCPDDHESDAVLKMGEKSGWRRCYKCRALVELAQGCTHITCRCKAQFCYICGAVWDPAVGCPNFCNGEEELERRRAEEEARLAELEAEKLALEAAAEVEATARREAERRTAESGEFGVLRRRQEAEMLRFGKFELAVREAMLERQSRKKLALVDKFSDMIDRMSERHAKTEQHLDDRQVMAEIELQEGLEEKEKKVRIKLRYMEDYCHGRQRTGSVPAVLGDGTESADDMPERRVTDRDLEQLRQQYCIRDGMERRHQSQINGLREKQAKSMEELVQRHEKEMEALVERRAEEIEDLAVEFADEEEVLGRVFEERRARLERRWGLEGEVLRVELEGREGKSFAGVGVPRWPDREDDIMADMEMDLDMDMDGDGDADGLVVVMEEKAKAIVGVVNGVGGGVVGVAQ